MQKPSGWSNSTPQALALARSELEAAGLALDTTMSWIEVLPRAEKVAITSSLEQALERLRSARSELLLLLEEAVSESSSLAPKTESSDGDPEAP